MAPAELLAAVALFLASAFLFCRGRQKKPNLPPGPFKFPVVGNIPQLVTLSHRSLGLLSRRHGPLMHLQVGRTVVVVASSAETAREVMQTHDVVFASRPRLTVAERLLYGCKDVIFAPHGEHWREARKVCVLHLLSARRVQSYRRVREEEVAWLMGEVSRQSPPPGRTPVDLSAMMRVVASGVVSRVALGRRYPERWKMIDEVSALVGEFFVEDFFPWLAWVSRAMGKHDKVRRCFRALDGFLDEVVEDHARRQGTAGDDAVDLVDVMLALQKEGDAGGLLTRECIKAIIWDMFGAATETSSITLEWAMSELVRKPTLMKKAQDEVRAIAGSKSMVAEGDLGKMDYLKAVIKETLRLHPPVPLLVPRESVGEAVISGFDVPAGTRVLVNVWAIMRDPQNWESPEEFMPERFLHDSTTGDYFRSEDFHFLPFGAGRRMCPGATFAYSFMALVLANLIHRFDWGLPEGMDLEDMDMREADGIATPRKTSLRLVAVPKDKE